MQCPNFEQWTPHCITLLSHFCNMFCRRRPIIPTIGTRADLIVIFAYIAAHKLDGSSSIPWGVRTSAEQSELHSP
jgi:hypothetical protein